VRIKDLKGTSSWLSIPLPQPSSIRSTWREGEQDAVAGTEDRSGQSVALASEAELAPKGILRDGPGEAGEMRSPAAETD